MYLQSQPSHIRPLCPYMKHRYFSKRWVHRTPTVIYHKNPPTNFKVYHVSETMRRNCCDGAPTRKYRHKHRLRNGYIEGQETPYL